jgi:type I restriction enzyme M protein
VGEDHDIERQDFVVTTSNKPLNLPQHIMRSSTSTVVPRWSCADNVLFEGGAGETQRRKLLAHFHLHTMIRLPTGIW